MLLLFLILGNTDEFACLGLTVQDMLDVDEAELAQLIRPVGFFNNKAKYIKQVAAILKEKAGDSDVVDIPDTYEDLIALPGVGPKMAFLVMDCAWNKYVVPCSMSDQFKNSLMRLGTPALLGSAWTRMCTAFPTDSSG